MTTVCLHFLGDPSLSCCRRRQKPTGNPSGTCHLSNPKRSNSLTKAEEYVWVLWRERVSVPVSRSVKSQVRIRLTAFPVSVLATLIISRLRQPKIGCGNASSSFRKNGGRGGFGGSNQLDTQGDQMKAIKNSQNHFQNRHYYRCQAVSKVFPTIRSWK